MPKNHKDFNPSSQEINKWFSDRGDNTHILNHSLDENSIVIDLGAYTGVWANLLNRRVKCKIYLLEPIKKFTNILERKYKNNPNIKILNFGISTENKELYVPGEKINNDATDLLNVDNENKTGEKIELVTLEKIMEDNKLTKIDLIQINIEGFEYDILENWIDSGLINKIRTLQIQFHPFEGINDPIGRRKKIQDNLENLGYKLKYKYDWVWECWEKN